MGGQHYILMDRCLVGGAAGVGGSESLIVKYLSVTKHAHSQEPLFVPKHSLNYCAADLRDRCQI